MKLAYNADCACGVGLLYKDICWLLSSAEAWQWGVEMIATTRWKGGRTLAATGEKKSRKRLNPPKGGGMTSGPKNGARTWLADASTPSQHGAGWWWHTCVWHLLSLWQVETQTCFRWTMWSWRGSQGRCRGGGGGAQQKGPRAFYLTDRWADTHSLLPRASLRYSAINATYVMLFINTAMQTCLSVDFSPNRITFGPKSTFRGISKENVCNGQRLQPGLSGIFLEQLYSRCVNIFRWPSSWQIRGEQNGGWTGESELYALLSFVFYHMSINIGCCNPSSVGFRYFCSARALITTVILRAGSLEKLLICQWASLGLCVLSGDHQINTDLGTIHSGLLPKICSDSKRGDVFALSSCFIGTSEGIWFCLSRAICVSLIMFSQSILGVFFLRLLSSPDLSPRISLSALLCRSESLHPTPRRRAVTFWYADAQTQVRSIQVHPTVMLTRSDSPRRARVRLGAQQASSTGHRGPQHPKDETPDWHEEECLM